MVGKRRLLAVAVAAAVGLGAGLSSAVAGPVAAEPDVTPPVITTNAAPAFVVGDQISASDPSDPSDDFARYTFGVAQQLRWTAADDSGEVCDFEVAKDWIDADPTVIYSDPVARTTPHAGTYVDPNNHNYDGKFGASADIPLGWVLRARDCAENEAQVRVDGRQQILVLQEDGSHAGYVEREVGSLTYRGRWHRTDCACASGGAMRKTSAARASVTYTQRYDRDDHVALVMAKGPSRGKAAIFVDGRSKATVNTYARTNQNRVVVYDKWMPAGVHTVRVVNLATARHPRIDLDAVMTN